MNERCRKSKTDIDEPRRAKLLREIVEPNVAKSTTDKQDASFDMPKTENVEPKRK
jgi:hypothetical protein